MAGLTLTQARTLVLDLLDDPNGRRFNPAGDFSKVDRALQAALSSCLVEYASEGGDVFDEETSATTSSAGLATLSVLVLLLRGVQVQSSNSFFPVKKQARSERVANDEAVRTLKIEFVRDYQVSTTAGHPLVGVGATAAPTWQAFDSWVCAEAALQLGITDNDKRPGLETMSGKRRATALSRLLDQDGRPLPNDVYAGGGWWEQLGYVFTPGVSAPTIQVVRTTGAW